MRIRWVWAEERPYRPGADGAVGRERAEKAKRVKHEFRRNTDRNHVITDTEDTEDTEMDHGIHTDKLWTRTHMYMFGLS